MATTSKFDDLLTSMGTGKWNLLFLGVISFWFMQIPMQSLGGAFLTPQVHHTCRLPPGATPDNTTNTTNVDSSCHYLKKDPESDKEERLPCTEWDFDNSTYGTTITEEFTLVCDRQYLRPFYNSIFFFGAFFGASVNGFLADRYGRKRMLAVSTLIYITLGNCINWIPGLTLILAFRFIMGTFHPACIDAGFTLVMEVFEPRYRSTAGIIIFLPWCFGMMALSGVAYLLADWRWLSFACSLPSFLFLPAIWSLDESPRWLIVRGHHDRALVVLRKAAHWNNASLPPEHELRKMMEDILGETRDNKTPRKSGLVAHLNHLASQVTILFSTRMMLRITLCVYAINLSLGTVYNGLTLGADIFTTNPYVYMAVSGVMEMPGNSLTIPIADNFGRRHPNMFFLFFNGVVIISLTFIPTSIGWLLTSLALIGKLTISSAYQIFSLHSCELFPTEVRTRGTGTSSMLSKLGATLAPFLVDSLRSVWLPAPYVVLGGATLMAAGITYLLPETKGVPLNDTVAALTRSHHAHKEEADSPRRDEKLADSDSEEPMFSAAESSQV